MSFPRILKTLSDTERPNFEIFHEEIQCLLCGEMLNPKITSFLPFSYIPSSFFTLITLHLALDGIIHIRHEMNVLVKMSQNHAIYISQYTNPIKSTCLSLHNLYMMPDSFTSLGFTTWTNIINIENTENFLRLMKKGYYVLQCMGIWFPFIILVRKDESPKISLCQVNNLIILDFSQTKFDRNCKITIIRYKRMISSRWIVGGHACALP